MEGQGGRRKRRTGREEREKEREKGERNGGGGDGEQERGETNKSVYCVQMCAHHCYGSCHLHCAKLLPGHLMVKEMFNQ